MKRMRKLAAVGLVLMCTLSMLSLSANACYNAGTSCWDESCENFEYASISDDEVMERAAVCMICREGYLRYKVITIPKYSLQGTTRRPRNGLLTTNGAMLPARGIAPVCCGGIQRGQRPIWHTTLRSKV